MKATDCLCLSFYFDHIQLKGNIIFGNFNDFITPELADRRNSAYRTDDSEFTILLVAFLHTTLLLYGVSQLYIGAPQPPVQGRWHQ